MDVQIWTHTGASVGTTSSRRNRVRRDVGVVERRGPPEKRHDCVLLSTVGYRVLETGGGRPASQFLTGARKTEPPANQFLDGEPIFH